MRVILFREQTFGRNGSLAQMRRGACALLLIFVAAATVAAQRRAAYTNPVMAGDFPDPSVIRVGGDYWAMATSSEWAPEFPILHSRDLINWQVVGAVFQKRPAWSKGNYWAPEITQDRGRFYVYYVGRRDDGPDKPETPLCVAVATANSPAGPYTDHGPLVCQEVGSIDGFHIRDEAGRRFLVWKEDGNSRSQPTPIWAQQLTEDGTRLVGERRELIRNTQAWERHATLPYGDLVEGPAIIRRGGWFYMFYSGNFCCARDCNYALGVARSRKLLGPWEKNPANPILAGNEHWKCPGHGTVVADARGRDWLMYHAYHAKDFVYVGRQALLDEVKWGRDGWPTINNGRGPSQRADAPVTARERNAEYRFFDDFTTARLAAGWQWPQDHAPTVSVDAARPGWLTISPALNQSGNQIGATLARTTTTGDYEATTVVETRGLQGDASAGLAAYGDDANALGISVGGGRVFLWRREKGNHRFGASMDAPAAASLHLRMRAREGHLYRFAISTDGRNWRDVGDEQDGSYLPPWDRGVRVALVAGGAKGAPGRFGFLRIEPRAAAAAATAAR